MLELGRKEQHLMGGIGFQILMVVLMVFAYTQAFRQVKLGRDLAQRLQEQLTVAREQVARRETHPDLAALRAQVEQLKSSLIPQGALGAQARRLEMLAQDRFEIRDARVKVGDVPAGRLSVPLEGQPNLEVYLFALEMEGTAVSRRVAGLLSAVSDPSFRPLCPLVAMELNGTQAAGNRPVKFSLKWVMAVSPDSLASSAGAAGVSLPPAGHPPAWGWREEPFLSAFTHPNALRIPAEKTGLFHLTGIVYEGASGPTCVINGEVLKPGEWVKEYQVILIGRDAVLLGGKGEEIILRLP